MKKLKRILALALCIITVGCFSSCLNGNDSSSSSSTSDSSAVMRKVTKEEWEAAFDALNKTNNVTLYTEQLEVDDNLKPVQSIKLTEKMADGKYYQNLHENIRYRYPPDSFEFNITGEVWAARIDGVDYLYGKDPSSGKWISRESENEMWYTLENRDFTLYKNSYEEMSYDETMGIYRLENKLVDADPIAYTVYYMTVEFRDGKIYRVANEADVVHAGSVNGEAFCRIEGKVTVTMTFYDYGTTEIVLPEVEE